MKLTETLGNFLCRTSIPKMVRMMLNEETLSDSAVNALSGRAL